MAGVLLALAVAAVTVVAAVVFYPLAQGMKPHLDPEDIVYWGGAALVAYPFIALGLFLWRRRPGRQGAGSMPDPEP